MKEPRAHNPQSIRVAIGIQARSTSKRFPSKVHEYIDDKTVLEHVLDKAVKAARYLNNWNTHRIVTTVAILTPTGDEIVAKYSSRAVVIDGNEEDVLSRYMKMQEHFDSDYVVRITGDCPLIPSFIISKFISMAVINQYDYLSNIDERCRTAIDGYDCEVISKRLLEYVDEHAKRETDREHVTTFIRRYPPEWIHHGTVINFLDLSHLKLSVDTKEELDNIVSEYNRLEEKLNTAINLFGKSNVHRL